MNYPYKSITDNGINLTSTTIGQANNSLIIDGLIMSDKPINDTNSLHNVTANDFHNPITKGIDVVVHSQNISQPEITLSNVGLKHDYPIYMIGLLGHTSLANKEVVYAVAMSNDPFILPKITGDELHVTFILPIGLTNKDNVKVIASKDESTTENISDPSGLEQFEHQTNQEIQDLKDKLNSIHLKGLTFDQIKK